MNEPIPVSPPSQDEALRNLVFIAVTIGIAYWVTVSVGVEELRATVEHLGFWGPLIIVLTKATTIIVVPLGGGPVYAVAGAVFGFWKGFLLTAVGDIVGFTAAFYLSRFFGRGILHFFMSRSHMPLIEKIVARGGEVGVFLKARLAFLGFPELFAYAAGLTSVSYLLFIVVQMLGHAPVAVLIVLLGDVLFTSGPLMFVLVSVGAVMLAVSGGYWLHKDLVREA